MRCKLMGRANFRKDGCISTVRLFSTITLAHLGLAPDIVVLIRFQTKGISHLSAALGILMTS